MNYNQHESAQHAIQRRFREAMDVKPDQRLELRNCEELESPTNMEPLLRRVMAHSEMDLTMGRTSK